MPAALEQASSSGAIRLIDVIWIERNKEVVIAAFKVEHSISIYSGIVRMLGLALGAEQAITGNFLLVAPDDREQEVRAQFGGPAFARVDDLDLRYLPHEELRQHKNASALRHEPQRCPSNRKAFEHCSSKNCSQLISKKYRKLEHSEDDGLYGFSSLQTTDLGGQPKVAATPTEGVARLANVNELLI